MDPANVGANFSMVREHLQIFAVLLFALPALTFVSIKFWIAMRDVIPSNMHLTASEGGKFDHLIAEHGLKTSKVVFSIEEAAVLGLAIDHDDSHAAVGEDSFALLIHGQQRKGSKAAEAMKLIA